MKKFIVIFLLIILFSPKAFANEIEYSKLIEDLPLMQGMVENVKNSVVFDKPSGRIIESLTTIKLQQNLKSQKNDIKEFYKNNLPSLGWKIISSHSFSRDGETLRIKVEEKSNVITVNFILTPNSEGN